MKKQIVKPVLKYNVVFDPCEEGGFTVTVPKLPGVITEGDTFEKALANVQDAIEGYLQVLHEAGEEAPRIRSPFRSIRRRLIWEDCPTLIQKRPLNFLNTTGS